MNFFKCRLKGHDVKFTPDLYKKFGIAFVSHRYLAYCGRCGEPQHHLNTDYSFYIKGVVL